MWTKPQASGIGVDDIILHVSPSIDRTPSPVVPAACNGAAVELRAAPTTRYADATERGRPYLQAGPLITWRIGELTMQQSCRQDWDTLFENPSKARWGMDGKVMRMA